MNAGGLEMMGQNLGSFNFWVVEVVNIITSNFYRTSEEQEWTATELKNSLRSIEWDLEDLEDTIQVRSPSQRSARMIAQRDFRLLRKIPPSSELKLPSWQWGKGSSSQRKTRWDWWRRDSPTRAGVTWRDWQEGAPPHTTSPRAPASTAGFPARQTPLTGDSLDCLQAERLLWYSDHEGSTFCNWRNNRNYSASRTRRWTWCLRVWATSGTCRSTSPTSWMNRQCKLRRRKRRNIFW